MIHKLEEICDKESNGLFDVNSDIVCSPSARYPFTQILLVLAGIHNVSWANHTPFCYIHVQKQVNWGREASAYLHFIITRFDVLPTHMIMVHSHLSSHHMQDQAHVLNMINAAILAPNSFIHIPCGWSDRLQPRDYEETQQWWNTVVKPYRGVFPPNDAGFYSYAQFIVSRDRVLRSPVTMYKQMLAYMRDTHPICRRIYNPDERSARYLEWTWHLLFGQPFHQNKTDVDQKWHRIAPKSATVSPARSRRPSR